MFVILLLVCFVIAAASAALVATLFRKPLSAILKRIISEQLYTAWQRYLTFAIYVVGISGGVRVWDLEKYIMPGAKGEPPLVLTGDRWVLEVYRTIIGTLQSTAWLLLIVFAVALIAMVIVRGQELRHANSRGGDTG
jgi:hypothetical protein